MAATATAHDPITAEVVNMAMQAIVLEMGVTIERTSGQPAATDAKDYSCVLCKDDGGSIAYYGNNLQHLGDSLTGTESVIATCGDESIDPDDVFIYNDPFMTGSLHQCDIAVQAPVFHQGELVAWIFTNIHHADIGGMTPSGFCPESRDVYGEGLRMPPIKVVDAGVVNESVMALIEMNVRTPIVLGDIRSQIAAINVGRARLLEVIEEHGAEEWKRYIAVNEELLARLLGERIAAIPPGRYHSRDWVEYDAFGGETYVPIECSLEVTEDARLVFDYSGSGVQVPGYSNGSRGAVLGSVMPVVLAALLPDHDVNAGVYDRVEVEVGEPGTVTNPTPPAGVSGGHMDTGARAFRAAHAALMQATASSEDEWIRRRSYALGGVSVGVPVVSGRRLSGDWGYAFVLDQQSLGHGGLATGDGVAFGGIDYSIAGRQPDVETAEGAAPILYLWRREMPDSGGPGAHRGGNSLETALAPWKVDRAELAVSSAGGVVPTPGARGGYPGGTTWVEVLRDALPEPGDPLPGPGSLRTAPVPVAAKCASFELGLRDVIRQVLTAGSGWGDPLLRPVEALARDLASGSISAAAAADVYGLVFDPDGGIDAAATASRRRELRSARLSGAEPNEIEDPTPRAAPAYRDGALACDLCGVTLSLGDDDAGGELVVDRHRLDERLSRWGVPVQTPRSTSFELVESCCPGCGTLVSIEVAQAR
ncbi:MAG TPA: hydantoinase B/oxoprolinase family protein [Solirubrobacterales bacterium]|nr:hydantoinase B/oxoprolinase family protein [Solirubrobacterales bacterium]